jgi:hypothetical protein
MDRTQLKFKAVYVSLAIALAGCTAMGGGDGVHQLRLTGAEEVPPVTTSATATGQLKVNSDRTVSGSFNVQGGSMIAAHIHEGAAGQNGPVIIPLQKKSDAEWVVPEGAKLTESQFEAYKAGRLYVNFHSPTNKGGEIRAQIKPTGGGTARSGGSY